MDDTEDDTVDRPPTWGRSAGSCHNDRQERPMAVVRPGPANEYAMDYEQRGKAIIFNNKKFQDGSIKERKDADAAKLFQRLRDLKFDVKLENDLSADDMKSYLARVAKEDHSRSSCFVCAVLTHGKEGVIWGKDKFFPMEELLQPFKGNLSPSLAGKPKIFILQADRDIPLGVETTDQITRTNKESPVKKKKYRIPAEADFLIATSVIPGEWSWDERLPTAITFQKYKKVSSFVFHLCVMMEEECDKKNNDKIDFLTLLTRVCNLVAFDVQKALQDRFSSLFDAYDLIPCVTSTLTKDIRFLKTE